jgi:hypothetical protein
MAALGIKPKQPVIDEGPPFPDELHYLWSAFQDISSGLSSSGFGPPMVTWEALSAWQHLVRFGEIEPWEATALVQLGMARAVIASEEKPKAPTSDHRSRGSSRK